MPLRNAAYVLPDSAQSREDFEWLKKEIIGAGGQATILAIEAMDAETSSEIVTAFRSARRAEYLALMKDIAMTKKRKQSGGPSERARAARAARSRLSDIAAIDVFPPAERRDAEALVEAMESAVPSNRQRPVQSGTLDRRTYRRRVWVTRPRPGVDRMSSAWLIRTFIDPDATFTFADKPRRSHVAFDMYEGDFTHAEGLCTFEVLAQRFGVAHPAVRRLGEIVHDIDLKERRYNAPEGPTVAALVEGIRQAHEDDAAALQQGIAMFDALSRTLTGPAEVAPAKRGTPGGRSRRSARR